MKARGKFERASSAKRGKLLRVYATSLLSLLLCCTMFVGTTMAWFTDSVSSASNQITAGELGVVLKCEDTEVTPGTVVFDDFAWAPGWALAKQFYVENNGTLPMQYELKLEADGVSTASATEHNPADFYIVYSKDGATGLAENKTKIEFLSSWTEVGRLSDVLLGKKVFSCDKLDMNGGNTHSVAIAMDPSAPNEIQGQKLNIKVTLNAYQEDAIVPDITISGSSSDKNVNSAALESAIAESTGAVAIQLGAGEYTMPSGFSGKDITIVGTKDTVIDARSTYLDGSQVAFEGVTIKVGLDYAAPGASDYAGIYSPNAKFTNCTFVGGLRVGRDGAEFVNCIFNLGAGEYVYNYGNTATFTNCTFNTAGKALISYSDGNGDKPDLTVTNCTFNATQGDKAGAIANQNCAAIEIDNWGCGVNLTTSGNKVDRNCFSGEWRIKSFHENGNVITVNGVEYKGLALDGKTMTIDAEKNVTVQ